MSKLACLKLPQDFFFIPQDKEEILNWIKVFFSNIFSNKKYIFQGAVKLPFQFVVEFHSLWKQMLLEAKDKSK